MGEVTPICEECRYSIKSYHALLCRAMNLPRPVAFMRDDRSECGAKGALFEPKVKYSEYDDAG